MELNEKHKVLLTAMIDAVYKRFDENEKKLMDEINNLKLANIELKTRLETSERNIEAQNKLFCKWKKN